MNCPKQDGRQRWCSIADARANLGSIGAPSFVRPARIHPFSQNLSHPHCHRTQRPRLMPRPPKTSEFWWEEEEEFDAVTDRVRPKHLYVLIPSSCKHPDSADCESAKLVIDRIQFVAGFCGEDVADFATAVWSAKAGPPLFLKMRQRQFLGCPKGHDSCIIGTSIQEFLTECLERNWRLDLDAGLGGKEPEAEPILIVCKREVAEALLQYCCDGNSIDLARTEMDGISLFVLCGGCGEATANPTTQVRLSVVQQSRI